MAPGRKIAGHACHKAWDPLRQQGGHPEPGVDHEHFVGLQGCSCLRYGPALEIGFTAVTRVRP